ncbi:uncharacterized protein LOC125665337 [Ostrea edulis]|uniref:uncharacterized protein LOC125665337 n=1 Tax=Ostrea edulis TaxID=37623 RepID=UPI0024AF777C|nr:uncharacterized protein LOC125665337 [Ostrea edulis]XP_056017277.1 uncharacterized protein LOC125665337 [Ostrea edulis]
MMNLCVYTSAEMEFHRIKVLANGVPVSEDVLYDKKNKVAILNVNGEDGNKSICQSSNFHDLERHILALKQVKSGKCYLVNTNETESDIEGLFDHGKIHQAKLLSYIARKDKVPVEDVEAEAGKKIANFCRNYDTYWLEDTTDERRDIQSSEQAPNCWFGCGICLFNIQ